MDRAEREKELLCFVGELVLYQLLFNPLQLLSCQAGAKEIRFAAAVVIAQVGQGVVDGLRVGERDGPAVVGVGPGILQLDEGTAVALDGQQGRIWVTPDTDKLAELQQQREAWLATQAAAKVASQQPAITQDGKQVEVVANIGRLADVKPALDNGAEGVGLLRTEFLYLDRTAAPSEEEQLAAYRAIAEVLGTRPLIIRTLDIHSS